VSQPYETLELRLTDEQIAAIRKRVARRKRKVTECGPIELAEINGTEDLRSSVKDIERWLEKKRLSKLGPREKRCHCGPWLTINA
jgi:hypothetical protein